MTTICGMDCCSACARKDACGGCVQTGGHPLGGSCIAAECVEKGGREALLRFKSALIEEINALDIPGLAVSDMNLLIGAYVNLEYTLPSGARVKLLRDDRVYWGNQVEIPGNPRCYGLVADEDILLVCTYGCGGSDPEIVLYKKR